MKLLLIIFAFTLIVTASISLIFSSSESDGKSGLKRAHAEVQKNSSSSLDCPSCAKANDEDEEKRKAEGKIDNPIISNFSGQQNLQPTISWKDLNDEWSRPVAPIPSKEEFPKYNISNGLSCPSCNSIGTQRICHEENRWCIHENTSCLSIFGETKIGHSYFEVLMKRCATDQDCLEDITTLNGFPFWIKEKICRNAKPYFLDSRGPVLFSIPALLVIPSWILLF